MNTSENWDNLQAATRSVRLTDTERAAVRESLALFMTLTPRRTVASKRTMLFGRFTTSIATATAAALSMSGIAFAAEGALPGDVLYPVKVSVNEEVRSAFTVDAEAQARWETERAARRLVEAEVLASKGELSEERQRKIETRVKAHVNRVKETARELRNAESPDVAAAAVANLEGTLRAHGRVIAAISAERNEPSSSLEESVREEESAIADERNLNDEAVRSAERFPDRAAEERRKAATKKIAKVRAYLEASEEKDVIDAKLEDADERLLSGDELSAAGEGKAAFTAYVDAQRVAQEASIVAKASSDLRLRIDGHRKESREESKESVTPAEAGDQENEKKKEEEESVPRNLFRFPFGH